MTDQNTAYREDYDHQAGDDPLAELERIISGDMPFAAGTADQPATAGNDPQTDLESMLEAGFEAELQNDLASEANGAGQIAEAATSATSLEDQLMAELGGGEAASPSNAGMATPVADARMPQAEPLMAPGNPVATAPKPRSLATPVATHVATPVATQPKLAETAPANEDAALERLESVARSFGEERHPDAGTSSSKQVPQVGPQAGPEAGHVDDLDRFFEDSFSVDLESTPATAQVSELSVTEHGGPEHSAMDHQLAGELEQEFADSFARELDLDVSREMSRDTNGNANRQNAALENHFAEAFARELGTDSHAGQAGVTAPLSARAEPDFGMDEDFGDDAGVQADAIAAREAGNPRGGFRLAVGALAAALVVGIGVVAWGTLNNSDSTSQSGAPVIKADAEPAKVKPEEPGGTVIANQDNQVYDRVAGTNGEEAAQEELITTREQPVEVASKTDSRLAPDAGEPEAKPSSLGLAPKRVRTLVVKPDGTIVSNSEVPADNTTAASDAGASLETASLQPPAVSDNASALVADTAAAASDPALVSIDGAITTGEIAIPEPSPLPAAREAGIAAAQAEPVAQTQVTQAQAKPAVAPAQQAAAVPAANPQIRATSDPDAPTQIAALPASEPVAAEPAPKPAVTSSEWKVQISSQRSRDAAEASFNNIRRRFASVLDGRSANIERADIEGKGTFYRVKVLAQSQNDASNLCSRLKSAGGSCFVTR